MRRSSLERAQAEIGRYLDTLEQRAFTLAQISSILEKNRTAWRLAKSTTLRKFVEFLLTNTDMITCRLDFPSYPTTLLFWDDPEVFEVAMLIRPNAYLSHLSAMQFHQLVDEHEENVVYINEEQRPKPSNHGSLEQARIDAAFERPPRITQNRAQAGDFTFHLLNGKYTNMLEVETITHPDIAFPVRVTSIERTLIDAAVRPYYSGGPSYILEAYKRAAPKINVEQMVRVLNELDYKYPYHQSIGFFMERSGLYSSEQIDRLDQYPKNYDFYADYKIEEALYSPKWRLYYPSYLDLVHESSQG